MTSFARALLAALALCWGALAATPTYAPPPTNTFCPPYYRKTQTNSASFVCGKGGTITDTTYLSRYCGEPDYGYYQGDSSDCYRSCAKDKRCISYSYDGYNQICTNYGKSVKGLGFKPSETNVYYYNLRGCYVCDQPPAPTIKSRCPATPTPLATHVNYNCGISGYFEAPDNFLAWEGISSPEECYRVCVQYESVGLCKSFSFQYNLGRLPYYCVIRRNSTLEQDFVPQNDTMDYKYATVWDLRGCFDCHLPPTPTSTCVPTPTPVNPVFRNGNFSLTTFNSEFNLTQPKYWGANEHVRSGKAANGNFYANFTANGTDYHLDTAYLAQSVDGFDMNPSSPGRFYNFSFDLAVSKSSKPPKAKGCTLSNNFDDFTPIRIADPKYGPNFKTVGPTLVDASKHLYNFYVEFVLDCFEITETGADVSGAGTVLIDNVRWTQGGRVVGAG